jgi:hypothetical protein
LSEREVGRLTLRKFYLLLAEWYAQQRLIDSRFYKLICSHLTKAPDPHDVFPLLDSVSDEDLESGPEDDLLSFQQATAALTSYGR